MQHRRDETDGLQPPAWNEETDELQLHSSVAYAKWLMARDSKCTPLKMLQGKIWQRAYAEGELHGEVYADVPRAFARWKRQGREICIYSFGERVGAAVALFAPPPRVILTTYISFFFDTRIGAKTESDSYCRIAESIKRSPNEVLFVSDAIKEVEAARLALMRALLCKREADAANFASKQQRNDPRVRPDPAGLENIRGSTGRSRCVRMKILSGQDSELSQPLVFVCAHPCRKSSVLSRRYLY